MDGVIPRRTFLKGTAVAAAACLFPGVGRERAGAAVRSGIGILGYDIEGPFDFVPTRKAALWRASHFDALVAPQGMYSAHIAEMYDLNPELEVGCYNNVMHTFDARHPEDWYLHTADGTRVKDGGDWTMNYLMNPLSGWIDHMISVLQDRLDRSGYNAVYIDGAGLGALGVSTAPPIDPRTHAEWTSTDWVTDMIEVTRRIRTAVSAPLWTNGIGDAKRYYDLGSSRMVPGSDRGFTEQYTRHSTWRIDQQLTPKEWTRTVSMTQEIGSKYAGITKVWVEAAPEEKDRWHRYALTTLLMGAAPRALYYFTAQRAQTVTPFHPYWRIARSLGAPADPTYIVEAGGLARRAFDGGMSLCNPTHDAVAWVADRPYRGVRSGQEVLLAPYDGAMLQTAA
jgi:hypothetical protein